MNLQLRKQRVALHLLAFVPSLAEAHPVSGGLTGWHAGFLHPLEGWDHFMVMLAVGVWVARKCGPHRWLVPVTFVGMMLAGGMAGVSGVSLPGVEFVVMFSVAFFGWMLLEQDKCSPPAAAGLAGFFAFFHGLAHGTELPVSASVASFVSGFVLTTLLVQGLGFVATRLVIAGLTCLAATKALGQGESKQPAGSGRNDDGGVSDTASNSLGQVVIEGRADNLVGIADSATQGTVGAQQLEERPILRSGEVLETVPGVIITQHAGGGKANQYFLRGFNLDHGTDFATFLDGMPLNLPTHGHGQGYSDMNIVIPELVQRVNYQKGVYYAENGDFSSAGAARLEFFKTLPQDLAIAEGGMYGYVRGLLAASPTVGEGQLLYGLEYTHSDGPWRKPDDYHRFNGLLTYSQGHLANGFSLTVRAYHGAWESSDQVASSAVSSGLVPFFGSLDDTTGGNSQRYSLQAEWHRVTEGAATKVMAYGFYYDLDLFSDFTYFLTDPHRGDQFEQTDKRWVAGLDASHLIRTEFVGCEMENTLGLQFRNDWIENGLFQTQARQRVNKTTIDELGVPHTLSATTRADDIVQTSVGIYFKSFVQWTEWIRSEAGVRGDFYFHEVSSTLAANSGTRSSSIASPKLSLIFGPWSKTEVYLQGGLGFHSNDGRGATTTIDPGTGEPVPRADPLVQTYGAELGVRTRVLEGLQSTLSFWWLDIDSELLFVGDAGATEASRPSRRYGVEWANFYNINKSLTLDADFSFSQAGFRDNSFDPDTGRPIGHEIPGAIESVVSAGLTYRSGNGLFASLRLRYFGPRPLKEDNTIRSEETILLNAQVGYHFNQTWTISAEILNLLDRRDHDIDYAYESRITPTAAAVEEIHFHPVEPLQVRFGLTARF